MGALQIEPIFHENTRGECVWSCLRCRAEFGVLSNATCHHIVIGQLTIAACCAGCRDVLVREILTLCPEPSFHGLPPGENDPGLPEGTPPDVAARISETHVRKVQTKR